MKSSVDPLFMYHGSHTLCVGWARFLWSSWCGCRKLLQATRLFVRKIKNSLCLKTGHKNTMSTDVQLNNSDKLSLKICSVHIRLKRITLLKQTMLTLRLIKFPNRDHFRDKLIHFENIWVKDLRITGHGFEQIWVNSTSQEPHSLLLSWALTSAAPLSQGLDGPCAAGLDILNKDPQSFSGTWKIQPLFHPFKSSVAHWIRADDDDARVVISLQRTTN